MAAHKHNRTMQRIRRRWRQATSGGDLGDIDTGGNIYPGSGLTNTTSDFLGDYRSVNSFHQLDMWRVRNRSRQIERGNPACIAFKRNMLNNVLGYKGFHYSPSVVTSKLFGDTTDGEPDAPANKALIDFYAGFGKQENFSTRKVYSRRDFDRLLLARLIFDGEVILRKVRGFPANDYKFAWQMIDPDYLDQNLSRQLENGNVIKMGVELEQTWKYPVAYWFFTRRPNDWFFDYTQISQETYYRVDASEIIHIKLVTEDSEQTRGWPWVFAAAVVLFRMGRYEEAALVNAAIGASRGIYFKKQYPEGFVGDPKELEDDGQIVVDIPEGGALELPYGVEPVEVDMKYPDSEFESFRNAMLLSTAMVFGTSYATTTGDLSNANFVSSRLGQFEERENYKAVQEFLIEKWKEPGADEELYRAILAGKVKLPITKFDKFNAPRFTGRRWQFAQPVDEWKARETQLNNLQCSIGDVIRETSQEEPSDVFKRISEEAAALKKLGLERIIVGKNEPDKPASPTQKEEELAGAPAGGK